MRKQERTLATMTTRKILQNMARKSGTTKRLLRKRGKLWFSDEVEHFPSAIFLLVTKCLTSGIMNGDTKYPLDGKTSRVPFMEEVARSVTPESTLRKKRLRLVLSDPKPKIYSRWLKSLQTSQHG
jgi:hypothetical protein